MNSNIFVTKPSLPPLSDVTPYLERIWESKILTNNGPIHNELENRLCDYLGVKHISLFSNATIGLLTALQALKISDQVITTPYSFVATAHSLLWNSLTPVFVDVDRSTFNIDPNKIEEAITPLTTAIMPVHCYGKPCDVDAIQKLADKHDLKVIYDAAHAFGVRCHCGSILNHGNLSVLSFHATKVFNTFEGGAIVSPDLETKQRIDQLKNFGFVDEITVIEAGINGKMSELHAAIGLAQLPHIETEITKRKEIDQFYRAALEGINGIDYPEIDACFTPNYGYFPILVHPTFPLSRTELYQSLKHEGIFTRRYFFPLISDFPMYRRLASASRENLPTASELADKVLCLPIYAGLTREEQVRIVEHIWSKSVAITK